MFIGIAARLFDTICRGDIVGGSDETTGDPLGLKNNLLLETGDDLLLEDGASFFLME